MMLIIEPKSDIHNYPFLLLILCSLVTISFCETSYAQIGHVEKFESKEPAIMLLGTYHMGAEGNNVIQGNYGDITTPKRQKEIEILVSKLALYEATKVALECDFGETKKYQERYQNYLEGDYDLTASERDQIGLRLAKSLGHKTIYCVDWNSGLPNDSLYNFQKFAQENEKLGDYLNKLVTESEKEGKEREIRYANLTVTEQLMEHNRNEAIEKSHQVYYNLARIGKNEEFVGANYVSWWYGRNLKIFMNILKLAESSDDRIFVLYGSGHTKFLRDFVEESEYFKVESPIKYLK